ncbi:MAG: DUF4446 family protein [Candidatus Krumholzibacteria bacterium]|nr:DUF4446 family protein [Candidatus Krumholzibacteria bacterium]
MNAFFDAHGGLMIVISLCIGAAALALSAVLLAQVSRLRRPFRSMAALHRETGTEESLRTLLKGVDENREFIRRHSEQFKVVMNLIDGCFSGMGMVRYNAFEDIGGNQSFSLGILDRRRNGWMLTSLVGRTSTRAYAIEVKDGTPSRDLSEEEREALGCAIRSLES